MPDNEQDKLIGAKVVPTSPKPVEIGIDTSQSFTGHLLDSAETSSLDINSIEAFSNVAQTREEVYSLIDTMSQDETISAILETYSEDTVETNDVGQSMWVESNDEKVAKYVNYLLDSLNVDKNIYSWAFALVKYGDLYLRLYRESDYGDDLLFGNTKKDSKSLKEQIIVNVASNNDHYVPYVELVANPGEMFELTKFGKTMGYIQANVRVQQQYDKNNILNTYLTYKMKKNDINVYDATTFVHACLQDNTSRTPEEVNIFLNDDDIKNNKVSSSYTVKRGQSILYNSFKIWRELALLENSLMLNRLTRSSIVRILNVEVGDMPKEQVGGFIQRLKEKIEQKSALNVGNSMTEYTNPGPIENIIYVPTHGEQGNISAQSIGGDVDVKGLADISYFQDKLFGGLRCPKQYFAQTDDSAGFNGGTSLSIISSRYGKAIKRIQNTLCQAVTDLVNIFLIDRGLTNYINKFTIRMQNPLTQEEIDRRENMRNRIGVINDIASQVESVIDDDVIKAKILKLLLSTSINDPEVMSLIQEYIDKKESEIEEGKVDEDESSNPPSPIGHEPSFEEPPFEDIEEEEPPTPLIDNEEEEEEIPQGEQEEPDYLPTPNDLGVDMTNNNEF